MATGLMDEYKLATMLVEPILSVISNDPTEICGGVFTGITRVLRATCITAHRDTFREALARAVTACVVREPPPRVPLADMLTPESPALSNNELASIIFMHRQCDPEDAGES